MPFQRLRTAIADDVGVVVDDPPRFQLREMAVVQGGRDPSPVPARRRQSGRLPVDHPVDERVERHGSVGVDEPIEDEPATLVRQQFEDGVYGKRLGVVRSQKRTRSGVAGRARGKRFTSHVHEL